MKRPVEDGLDGGNDEDGDVVNEEDDEGDDEEAEDVVVALDVDINVEGVVGIAAELEAELELGFEALLAVVEEVIEDTCIETVKCKVVDEVTNVVVVLFGVELDTEPALLDMETDVDANELVTDELALVEVENKVENGDVEEIKLSWVDDGVKVEVGSNELEDFDMELIEVIEEAAVVVIGEAVELAELDGLPLLEVEDLELRADEPEGDELEAIVDVKELLGTGDDEDAIDKRDDPPVLLGLDNAPDGGALPVLAQVTEIKFATVPGAFELLKHA